MTLDLEAMRRAAEAARLDDEWSNIGPADSCAFWGDDGDFTAEPGIESSVHIAVFRPVNALALLDLLDAKDAEIATLRAIIDEADNKLLETALRADRAEAALAQALDALKPFADDADNWSPAENDGHVFDDDHPVSGNSDITVGDLRRAEAALNARKEG